MSYDPALTITGIQEAQHDNLRMIAALRPDDALGRMVKAVAIDLHRYKIGITHVDTGSLRAAQQLRIENGGARAVLFTDEGAINPRSGSRPAVYGLYEEERGGAHAAAQRTVDERAVSAVDSAVSRFVGSMP